MGSWINKLKNWWHLIRGTAELENKKGTTKMDSSRPKGEGPKFSDLLINMLQRQTLTKDQAQRILNLMLSNRLQDKKIGCRVLPLLPDGVRTSNVENRALIEEMIVGSIGYYDEDQAAKLKKKIPDFGPSLPDVERRVRYWHDAVNVLCPAADAVNQSAISSQQLTSTPAVPTSSSTQEK
ncbi:MAG: hypothetical protein ACREGC_03030 [Minisyncoccia bacterium]